MIGVKADCNDYSNCYLGVLILRLVKNDLVHTWRPGEVAQQNNTVPHEIDLQDPKLTTLFSGISKDPQ